MKNRILRWVVIAGLGVVFSAKADNGPVVSTNTPKSLESYSIGVDLARNFKRQGIDVDMEAVIRGMMDASAGRKLSIPETELSRLITKVQNDQRLKMAQNRGRNPAEVNRRVGADFLARNESRPGVVTLQSGLQYKVVNQGSGKKPGENDTVLLSYRTSALDGKEYNCSNAGQPGSFKVKELETPAWREAVKLMPVGSKWELYVPSNLGYGVGGVGSTIGPNETLVVELELVAIK
ncbi:MAG: FKBP-type peptidyl-prolyl cis-trans isomerase [Verrucomicrobia bacterium]|jgi:FKBP-type peptidyl-prolyl cis-trans isomerase FklB|nr:FKBP-type peptidyl-prolyl cis-trans isomerase [Verrucomicrobiota bacterium]